MSAPASPAASKKRSTSDVREWEPEPDTKKAKVEPTWLARLKNWVGQVRWTSNVSLMGPPKFEEWGEQLVAYIESKNILVENAGVEYYIAFFATKGGAEIHVLMDALIQQHMANTLDHPWREFKEQYERAKELAPNLYWDTLDRHMKQRQGLLAFTHGRNFADAEIHIQPLYDSAMRQAYFAGW